MVSVILPTYNGARFIRLAIQSVLTQSWRDLELLVIDDGSTDETAAIVEALSKKDGRVKYFKNEENVGIQKSLNRGITESRGDYLARIDDDDQWVDKEKLAQQVGFLEAHPQYVLIGTGVIMRKESGGELFRFLNPTEDVEIRDKMLFQNCFVHSSVVFRKDAGLRAGGYGESQAVRHVEDYDLWLRMGSFGKFHNLPIYGVAFLIRASSLSALNRVTQFSRDLSLIWRFRKAYPHYIAAFTRGLMRLVGYFFFGLLPVATQTKIWEFYKRQSF